MRKLASLLTILATGAVLAALGFNPAKAETISIAHSTWVGYGPLYIARDKGFFKKNGVDVELIVMEDPKERFPTDGGQNPDDRQHHRHGIALHEKPGRFSICRSHR